jgi:hypothetical protein
MRGWLMRALYLGLGLMLGFSYATKDVNDTLGKLNNGCVNLIAGSFYNGCLNGKFESTQRVPAGCKNMTRSWYESIRPLLPVHGERAEYNFSCTKQ